MTTSPGFTPASFTARCSAAVPEDSAAAAAAPMYSAVSFSNPVTFAPSGATQLVSNASFMYCCSSPCMVGEERYILFSLPIVTASFIFLPDADAFRSIIFPRTKNPRADGYIFVSKSIVYYTITKEKKQVLYRLRKSFFCVFPGFVPQKRFFALENTVLSLEMAHRIRRFYIRPLTIPTS